MQGKWSPSLSCISVHLLSHLVWCRDAYHWFFLALWSDATLPQPSDGCRRERKVSITSPNLAWLPEDRGIASCHLFFQSLLITFWGRTDISYLASPACMIDWSATILPGTRLSYPEVGWSHCQQFHRWACQFSRRQLSGPVPWLNPNSIIQPTCIMSFFKDTSLESLNRYVKW